MDVTQNGNPPPLTPCVAVQSGGNAGGVTLSKFSKISGGQLAVAVGVTVAVAVAVVVAVAVAVAIAVAVGVTVAVAVAVADGVPVGVAVGLPQTLLTNASPRLSFGPFINPISVLAPVAISIVNKLLLMSEPYSCAFVGL